MQIHEATGKVDKFLRPIGTIFRQQIIYFFCKCNNSLVESHYLRDICSKEFFYTLLIKLMTCIQVVCMLFVCTLLTNQSSVVATIAVRKIFWVILAKYLEIILSLCDLVFDDVINLNRD